jgi:hypothetical protein
MARIERRGRREKGAQALRADVACRERTSAHAEEPDRYAIMLADPDPIVHDKAARAWCTWEDAHVSLTPGHTPNPRYQDPEFRLRFARLVTHYWRHAAFLAEDQLVRDAAKLNGIPGVLIHGRYDVSGPARPSPFPLREGYRPRSIPYRLPEWSCWKGRCPELDKPRRRP